MRSAKIKRATERMLEGAFLILEPVLTLLLYCVGVVGLLGWLLYRLVRPAPEQICAACGEVHTETCPCCSWICPVGDDEVLRVLGGNGL